MKKLLLIIAGLAAAVVVLGLVAPSFISVDAYKNQIKTRVEAATGRTLTIDGKLSLRFFPVAGITAENVTLSNPPGFADKTPFATFSAVTIDVAVMPLLHKEIVVKNFVLKDPVINMAKTKAGKQNWTFTSATTAVQPQPAPQAPAAEDAASAPGKVAGNFMLNNFEIANGTLHYANGTDAPMELKKINASVVLQSSETAAAINGSVDYNGKTISVKAGVGTLKSMLEDDQMEINATLKSDLFNAALEGNYDQGGFSGKENIKSDSLKELIAWLTPGKPVTFPGKLALQSESDLTCTGTQCDLTKLHFILDTLDAKGNLKISWYGVRPALEVNLIADALDLNPYLTPQKAAANDNFIISDAMAAAAERWSSAPIDLSALGQIDVKANIETSNIKFRNITAGRTVLSAKLEQGVLNADVSNDNFYKGTGTLTATVNAAEKPAQFDTHILLKSVALGPLLKDTMDNENMNGVADIQATLKSSGNSVNAMVSSLSGEGQARVQNGEIKHFSLIDMVHNVSGAFGTATAQNTVFTQLGGSFTIAQGVVTNHDLALQTQGINVTGDGSVNLPAYTVNYRLKPQLQTQAKDAAGASTTKEGLGVPVIIEGSLDAPAFRPDLASVVQEAIKNPQKLKEELKNTTDQLKSGSTDQLKNTRDVVKTLKGRFGLR